MERLSLEEFLALIREIAADAAAQPDPDLCLRHLRAGLIRLGFRRAGAWTTDPDRPGVLHGTWGTGWESEEVDEHDIELPIGTFVASERIVQGEKVVLRRVRPPPNASPLHRGYIIEEGTPNSACVALRADGQLFGIISVDMLPDGPDFTQSQVAALELIADVLAIVVARGRTVASLHRELAERRRLASDNERLLEAERLALAEAENAHAETAALYEATKSINRSLDFGPTLLDIIDSVIRLTGCGAAGIALLEAGGQTLRYEAVRGEHAEEIVGIRYNLGEGLTGYIAESGLSLNVPDVRRDPGWIWRGSPEELSVRSALFVPLRSYGRIIGVLSATSTEIDHFSAAHLRQVNGVAEPAALAISHAREIAERREAERALRESEERFRLMAETSGDALYRLAFATMRYDYMSPAIEQLTGYSVEGINAIGFRSIVEKVFDLSGEEISNERLRQRRESGDPSMFKAQYLIRAKNGEPRWLEDHSFPWWDADGRVLGSVGILSDVTERKRLEEQLRQALKMEAVGRLAGGIAHDFNNLLTVINGYAELLQSVTPADSPASDYAAQIAAAGESASNLTRGLLAFSRRQVISLREIALNAVVERVSKMLRRLIGEDIALAVNLNAAPGLVKADAGQLEQMLLNLAANARDAMPRGGTLIVRTENVEVDDAFNQQHPEVAVGRYVMLAVSDTGVGMSPETLAHVFEPFFTTKETGQGTGLGLAAVYGIVRQHGGTITVYSELGHGTTFRIYLPFPAAGEPGPPEPVSKRRVPTGTETILLVEDEDRLRELTQSILTAAGYSVLACSGGDEALRRSDELPGEIHLLLADVVMPGLGGREVAEELSRRRPGIKVVFMSGYTDDAVVRSGAVGEGVAFLQKPFTLASLTETIRSVLDSG